MVAILELGCIQVKGEIVKIMQTNSLTLARQGDGLGYIRICANPPRRLVF